MFAKPFGRNAKKSARFLFNGGSSCWPVVFCRFQLVFFVDWICLPQSKPKFTVSPLIFTLHCCFSILPLKHLCHVLNHPSQGRSGLYALELLSVSFKFKQKGSFPHCLCVCVRAVGKNGPPLLLPSSLQVTAPCNPTLPDVATL